MSRKISEKTEGTVAYELSKPENKARLQACYTSRDMIDTFVDILKNSTIANTKGAIDAIRNVTSNPRAAMSTIGTYMTCDKVI